MEMDDDLLYVLNQVITHLPAGPDTTGVFLLGAAGSAPPSNDGAAGSGAALSTEIRRSAPSGPSAGPLLPGDVCSAAPSVSAGSGRVLSSHVSVDGDAFASSCRNATTSDDVSSSSAGIDPADLSPAVSSVTPGPRLVLSGDISSVASADAGAIVTVSGVSASEGPCFSVLPGDVCSSALGSVLGAATASSSENCLSSGTASANFNSTGVPVMCQPGALPKKAVLDLHPGPIELFRIDSTTWRERNSLQWRVWLQKLINKNVKQLIICGRWPKSPMEVLPNNLAHCKSLQKIHLCFFSLPNITDSIVFPCLQELQLCYCLFEGADLENILRSSNLIKLELGYVKLGTVRIQSETLRRFALWSCDIDVLYLSDTPSLTFFGQEPSWSLDHRSHIQIQGIPQLHVLNAIYLNQQSIELFGYHIKADMVDHPSCWTVTSLALVVDFSNPKDLAVVPSLLRCFPKLKSLTISRLDSHVRYTGPTIDWHGMVSTIPCIKTDLNIFKLYNGRGDDVEKDLAKVVLRCAGAVKEVNIQLHPQFCSGTGW